MITHPLPAAGKLPIKTYVARQLPTHTHTHTLAHAYIFQDEVEKKPEITYDSYTSSWPAADLRDVSNHN